MLSEEAIQEIDRTNQTDTDMLAAQMPGSTVVSEVTDLNIQADSTQIAGDEIQETIPVEVVAVEVNVTQPQDIPRVVQEQEEFHEQEEFQVEKVAPSVVTIQKLVYTKPSKFRLLCESAIYEKIGEESIEIWDKGKTFTSNRKRGEWILITGQITANGWKQSEQKLWIHSDNIKKIR